jgi:hypothetical protein
MRISVCNWRTTEHDLARTIAAAAQRLPPLRDSTAADHSGAPASIQLDRVHSVAAQQPAADQPSSHRPPPLAGAIDRTVFSST